MLKLKEIIALNRRPVKINLNMNYPEIGVFCFGKGIFHKEPKDGLSLGSKKIFLVREGDFIMSITFGWEGAVALAGPNDDGKYCSIRFPTFSVNRETCNPEFLLNFFRTSRGVDLLKKVSPGSAGRNRVLAISRLLEEEIPLPCMDKQNEIVAKIKRIEKLQSLRGDLMRDASLFRMSYLEKKVRELGDSPTMSLREALSQAKRKTRLEIGRRYKLVGLHSGGNGLFIKAEKEGYEIKAADLFLVREGDFIYSRLFAWNGSFAIVGKEFDNCFASNEFPTFEVDRRKIDPHFLLLYLCRQRSLDEIERLCSGTTKMSRNRLKEDRLLDYKIRNPSLERQREIVAQVSKVESYLSLQEDFLDYLNNMKTVFLTSFEEA
jgi:restriction endonuclease S subunit